MFRSAALFCFTLEDTMRYSALILEWRNDTGVRSLLAQGLSLLYFAWPFFALHPGRGLMFILINNQNIARAHRKLRQCVTQTIYVVYIALEYHLFSLFFLIFLKFFIYESVIWHMVQNV